MTIIKPRVAVIILNYNNPTDTISCLQNIREIDYDNFQTIIIDNHSTDDSVSRIKDALLPSELFIKGPINKGYAAGNNLGIKKMQNQGTDYFCILNNDVEVSPNFLDILVTKMTENPNLGIVGPKICDFDNRDLVQATGSIVDMNFGRATELNKNQPVREVASEVISCDYVGGACMVVRSKVIEQVGLIPEDYFLFYEENEWCAKVKQAGYQIACVTDATVYHKGSHTINQISGLSEYFMYRNLVIFVNRNGSFKNRMIFLTYFIGFCFKSLLFKKHGGRFFCYFWDAITGVNRYQYLQK